jgi:hypothetical protein
MKPVKSSFKKWGGGIRKSKWGGEFDQSTLYVLWKFHDENPFYN